MSYLLFFSTSENCHIEYSVKHDGKVLIKMHNKISILLDMSHQELIFILTLKEQLQVTYFLFLDCGGVLAPDNRDSKL